MTAGRPKKTLDILPRGWRGELIRMGDEGASDVEMRVYLDISNDLWYRFLEEEPEFSETVKRAQERAEAWWNKVGRSNLELSKGESFNSTTWIFNMKNRFNWRDKQDVNQSGGLTINMKKEAEASD